MRRAPTAKQATFAKRSACWLKVFFRLPYYSTIFLIRCPLASNAIELIDYGREAAGVDSQKIQAFHRFLVDHLSSEGNAFPHNPTLLPRVFHSQSPSPAPISQLIGVDGKNIITCSHCKDIREKDNLIHVIDLVYSRKVSKDITPPECVLTTGYAQPTNEQQPIDFAFILQNSLFRTITHKATCQNCKQYNTFTTCRSLSSRSLPPFLAVNASVYNEDSLSFWQDPRSQRFLQPQVHLHGQVRGIHDSQKIPYTIRVRHSFYHT
jgi:PAB-dependent poly(A)-specific ribonuclease subunit 2